MGDLGFNPSFWTTFLADFSKASFGEKSGRPHLTKSCDAHFAFGDFAGLFDEPAVRQAALVAWIFVLARHAGVDDVVVAEDTSIGAEVELIPRRAQVNCDTPLRDQISTQIEKTPTSAQSLWDYVEHLGLPGVYGFIRVSQSTATCDFQLRSQDTPLYLSIVYTCGSALAAVSLHYGDESFHEKDAHYMLDHFLNLFRRVLVDSTPGDAHLMTAREIDLTRNLPSLVSLGGFPVPEDPSTYTYGHDLLSRSVRARPKATAIVWQGTPLYTYAALDEASTKLSYHLAHQHGIRPGDVVVIFSEHSPFVIVAMYALLKAGAAYLPIDLESPHNIIEHAVNMVDAKLLLTIEALEPKLDAMRLGRPILSLDRSQSEWDAVSAEQIADYRPDLGDPDTRLAYVNLTSGSTGLPKGCMISHRSLVHWIVEATPGYGRTSETRTLQICKLQFDGIVEEIFMTHYQGGVLCLAPPEAIEASLKDVINSMNVTMLTLTPTRANLLDPADVPSLSVLILTGEPLRKYARERWLEHGKTVYNAFGPTETICCFMLENPVRSSTSDCTPCGVTLCPSTRVYCLDSSMRTVPIGCVGEICVSGPSVGLGYFGNEEKTKESYTRDPFRPEYRMYKTGDLGRLNFEGRLTSLGRRDQQIKLNGNRIELGGVEAVLLAAESSWLTCAEIVSYRQGSRLAVFMAKKSFTGSHEQITLCLTPDARTEALRLSALAAAKLPNYMVPTLWIPTESVPLTVSGKLNRKAIKQYFHELLEEQTVLVGSFLAEKKEVEMPTSETELELQAIWASCLNIPRQQIGVHSSLFDLGADSLSVLRLATLLGKAGYKITPMQLRRLQTVSKVAEAVLVAEPQTVPTPSSVLMPTIDISSIADDLAGHGLCTSSVEAVIPATPFQKGVLLHPADGPDAFMSTMRFSITRPIDAERFIAVLNELRETHPILRTVFLLTQTQSIVQVLLKEPSPVLVLSMDSGATDLTSINDALPREFTVHEWGKLAFNFVLAENAGCISELIIAAHHALFDGWSIRLLLNDLMKGYSGQLVARPAWQNFVAYSNATDVSSSNKFWRGYLTGVQAATFCRPKALPYHGTVSQIRSFAISLSESSKTLQVMDSILMSAAWAVVQYIHGGAEDVIFNIVSSGRDAAVVGVLDMIGPCLTHYPLRIDFAQVKTIKALLRVVQEAMFATHDHTVVGTGEILKAAGLPDRAPLSNVDFIFQAIDDVLDVSADEMWIKHKESSLDSATPLTLQVQMSPDRTSFSASASYDQSAVSAEEASLMLDRFGEVIRLALTEPETELTAAKFMVPGEMDQTVLRNSNAEPVDPSERISAWDRFISQVREQPDALALQMDDGPSLTFLELYHQVNAYAVQLLSIQCQNNRPVLIHLGKSVQLIVSVLACFRAGICFCMASPDSPRGRMDAVIEDIRPSFVISQEPGGAYPVPTVLPPDISTHVPSEVQPTLHSSDAIAWIMTTSGTTGRPKPIAFTRSNLDAFINGDHAHRRSKRSLSFASVHFDASLEDIFSTLCYGGCLCLATDSVLRGDLPGAIRRMGVQVVCLTSTVAKLLAGEKFDTLETLMLGGEPLSPQLRDALLATGIKQLQVGYGPCESTVKCFVNTITPGDPPNRPLTLGTVFGQNRVVVLDSACRPVPFGATGELCVGGPQVSTGYIGLPEKTAQSFVALALPGVAPETRWYRTGDIVRLLPGGSVVFLGRRDRQVKVRGQRVELGEVEACLLDVAPCVAQVAVAPVVDTAGAHALAAFVVLRKGEALDVRATLERLKDRVVAAPSAIIEVGSLPVNASGKLDEAALQKVYGEHREGARAIECQPNGTPDSETPGAKEVSEQEVLVRTFWARVLGVHECALSLDTSFSDVGGDSFKWMQLSQAFVRAKIRVTLKMLMGAPTIRQQARFVLAKKA